MRVNLKKRLAALMMAGLMVTSNVLPAYSGTDGIASSYQTDAEDNAFSSDEASEAKDIEASGGESAEKDSAGAEDVSDLSDEKTGDSADADEELPVNYKHRSLAESR